MLFSCAVCSDEGAVRAGGSGFTAGRTPVVPVRLQQAATGQVFSEPVGLSAALTNLLSFNLFPNGSDRIVCVIHRAQRVNRSPGPGPQPAGRNSPGNPVSSMVSRRCRHQPRQLLSNVHITILLLYFVQLSPSFTPTSVIRKMYATKDKSREEASGRPETKEDPAALSQDGTKRFP